MTDDRTDEPLDTDADHVEPSVEGIPMEADTASEAPSAEEAAAAAMMFTTTGILRMMLGMLADQAWVELGLRLPPGATETRTDLPQARLAIDTIAYLQKALAEDSNDEEQREVEQLLATLRLNYVQRS